MELDPRLAEVTDTPSSSSTKVINTNSGNNNNNNNDDDDTVNHNLTNTTTSTTGPPQFHHLLQDTPQQQQPSSSSSPSNHQDPTTTTTDPKRSRACEACRGLKVRCEPDPLGTGPCRRCSKAGRQCVVTAPTRKRQKKTDSRVSELERKIDALTASLQARGQVGFSSHFLGGQTAATNTSTAAGVNASSDGYGGVNDDARASWGASTDRTHDVSGIASTSSPATTRRDHHNQHHQQTIFPSTINTSVAGQKRKIDTQDDERNDNHNLQVTAPAAAATTTSSSSSPWAKSSDGDVVDRGLITMDLAANLFDRYRDRMAPHFPAVVFPPGTNASELRRTRPTLFLAIMASASSETTTLQKTLQHELMLLFAEKIFLTSEKSLEIVQALMVAVIWHWPPENHEELKIYQLIHIAAVMALDIGLGKRNTQKRSGAGGVVGTCAAPAVSSSYGLQGYRRMPPPDPTTIESRRTWLTCFFLTSNASMALHRPNLVKWTPFMAESVDILQTSPDAAPTDKYFCHLIWTHRLGEDVGTQFSMDDSSKSVDINDPQSQHALKTLERDLDAYRASVSPELLQPTLKLGFDCLRLYMHEAALHNHTTISQFRPPFNADLLKDGVVPSTQPLSAMHISSITACLTAVNAVFSTFLSLDVPSIRCLPSYNLVRVAYAVVILVKMHFSASAFGGSDVILGGGGGGMLLFDQDSLRVEDNLNVLIDKFRAAAEEEKSRPASKFLVILSMLKGWFLKQTSKQQQQQKQYRQRQQSSNNNTSPIQQLHHLHHHHHQQTQQQQQNSAANTPLQLLSEVATGTDSNKPPFRPTTTTTTTLPHPHPYFTTTTNIPEFSSSSTPKTASSSSETPWIMPLDPTSTTSTTTTFTTPTTTTNNNANNNNTVLPPAGIVFPDFAAALGLIPSSDTTTTALHTTITTGNNNGGGYGYDETIADPFVYGVFQGLHDTNNIFPMFPF